MGLFTKSMRVSILLMILLISTGLFGCSYQEMTSEKSVHAANKQKENTKNPAADAVEESSDFNVTLLGTGSPIFSMERFGNATLVEAGEEKLLFDAGRGAALRLSQANVMPSEINKLFITHLHSDHTIGIPDLWLTGTLTTAGKRAVALNVWGPKGTKNMMKSLEKGYEPDIEARIEHGHAIPEGTETVGHDIEPGIVYEKNGVQVVAFLVDHDITPAYGYRVNYKGHSVVISGDTTYNENLIQHAKNVDLLIHEVCAARPEDIEKNEGLKKILAVHTTPEEAGEIFSKTNPKLAVFSHIVLLGGLTEKEGNLIERAKTSYDGKIVIGQDLMSFAIGHNVTVGMPD